MSEPATDDPPRAEPEPPRGGDLVWRHAGVTRIWHWTNAVAAIVLLMSGLTILNAHPRLYWGQYGANPDRAWLEFAETDGVAFPGWATIPSTYSLSDARLWHFAFAWVFALALAGYLAWALVSGHLRRDLAPRRAELAPRRLWHDVAAHARLRFPTGAAAREYNVLQKLAYGAVLGVLLPGMILAGLAMSPGIGAGFPWLVDLLGGRQSARSLHFIGAGLLVGFVLVHVAMVILAGPVNELRSMITGWYRLPREPGETA